MHREIVALVILCALAVMGFMFTRAAATANRARRLRDADAFYRAGEQDLARGQTRSAVAALRHAAAISRENRTYQLALAAGLAADGQDDTAQLVLLGVRSAAPEDPEVNVRLARLEARRDDPADALRYYQNALHGSWDADQSDARRRIRIELIRYLLAHGESGRALSELLVLLGNLPDDVTSQTEAGQLLLEAGDARRALDRFREALRIDPTEAPALAGAGEAAFQAGDYATTLRYLRRLADASERIADLRTVADLVLTRDPLRPGLSLRQRHERMTAGLARALEALDECRTRQPQSAAFESLRAEAVAFQSAVSLAQVRRRPEAIDAGLDLIYRIERSATGACGRGSAFDRALVLIGRRHDAEAP